MADLLRFPSTGGPDDAAARRTALDTHLSCIVEAPAGSGKTGLLTQRFLKLLAGEDIAQPEEILAITFTNKAAAELRERVLEQLHAAHHNHPVPAGAFAHETRALARAALARDTQQHWQILARPQRLNLRTIDSVCAEIASTVPLLSGSGAALRPVTDAGPLFRLAAQRTLLQLGGPDPDLHAALRTVLLHRDGSLADCETLLARMLSAREQWGELVPLTPGALDDATLDNEIRTRLERTLETIVCAGLSRAARAMPAGLLEELTAFAARVGIEPGYKGKESPIAFCANKNDPPEAVAEHLDHWVALISLLLKPSDSDWRASFSANHIGFTLPKHEVAYLKQIVESIKSDELKDALCAVRNLPPAKYPDEQWEVAKALFHVLRRSLAELQLLFAERGECDFTEIALAARAALRADGATPDLALTFGGKLRHLLVDEMQDTSAGQYELIDLLTRSWDGQTQTLFLVGDPKQSIYLFRQARVERFLRTMRERCLGEIHLHPLQLTANFRSQATLVEAFNHNFELLFPHPADLTPNAADVPFVAATPSRETSSEISSDEAIHWHTSVFGEERLDAPTTGDPARDHELQQAREIRRIVEYWRSKSLPPDRRKRTDGSPEPWRIAVLTRARSHLSAIVAEFKRDHGNGPLRYRAVDIDPLDERPEVLDAFALTRALLHPADRVAWLAVLHAPWCGLALADLLALTGEADPSATLAQLVPQRRHLLSDQGRQLLERAWPILEAAIANTGRSPIDIQVERTWRSLGGDAPLTPDRRTNVLRFLEVLREAAAEPAGIDLATLHPRLRKLYAEPDTGDGAVELLTIHKSKGLEWDVVIAPSLERQGGRTPTDFLNWLELDASGADAAGILLAPIHGKGEASSQLNQWMRKAKEARDIAERKRLFYVTCTRAQEELHLFAACKRKQNQELAQPAYGSLLQACWPAAAEHFAHLAFPSQSTSQPTADLNNQFLRSLNEPSDDYEPLALAASAEEPNPNPPQSPLIHRLPPNFDPLDRFTATDRLPYLAASALTHSPAFDRPEGSFAVRAFGNVVHRYLQVLATRLETTTPETLLAELPQWEPRLTASLRGEGLPPTTVAREAKRALAALTRALTDETGRWILSPHPQASSERALNLATAQTRSLRADRTFAAGPTPLTPGDTLWIVDFKTAEQGSRSDAVFEAAELVKYRPQLETYAHALRALPNGDRPIQLGLYYPLIPRLLHWPAP